MELRDELKKQLVAILKKLNWLPKPEGHTELHFDKDGELRVNKVMNVERQK